jgi:bifunctional DNase/RNase
MVRELSVVGVRVELPSNQPLVLLKESDGERYLPIWIGPQEATAIAHAQQGVVTARPMTHDLLRNVLQALQAPVDRVVITELQEGTFLSNLVFVSGLEVSSRPSDAIALALRMGVPVFAEDSVLDSAGVAVPDEQESEVEKFREFLDTISPDDFNIGS